MDIISWYALCVAVATTALYDTDGLMWTLRVIASLSNCIHVTDSHIFLGKNKNGKNECQLLNVSFLRN